MCATLHVNTPPPLFFPSTSAYYHTTLDPRPTSLCWFLSQARNRPQDTSSVSFTSYLPLPTFIKTSAFISCWVIQAWRIGHQMPPSFETAVHLLLPYQDNWRWRAAALLDIHPESPVQDSSANLSPSLNSAPLTNDFSTACHLISDTFVLFLCSINFI